jgi:hypothetical protein
MNWLETVFGISPDGGNGMAELLVALLIALVLALVLATGVVARRRFARGRRTKIARG